MRLIDNLFQQFLKSEDNLWVSQGGKIIFTSRKEGLLPLLDYLGITAPAVQEEANSSQEVYPSRENPVIAFDRLVGNAASLLLIKARCQEIYSSLGSELAIKTLSSYKIKYRFTNIIPYVLNQKGNDLCPMEKLSLGKTPEEFYQLLRGKTS